MRANKSRSRQEAHACGWPMRSGPKRGLQASPLARNAGNEAPQNAPATRLNIVCTELPTWLTPAMITIAISEAISAYSIAVAPRVSFGSAVRAGRAASV